MPDLRKKLGDFGEQAALAYLLRQGYTLVARKWSCAVGELDLIMREGAALVFVEVRVRADSRHGGAAASIGSVKQRRIIHAAQQFLQRFPEMPPCRFDVMVCDQPGPPWQWTWIVAAFDAA